jgi:predicted ATP-grasp superfamily ATP-dependent carboligase
MLHLAAELHADESWPVLADIPHEGTTIRAGGPILTLMAAGREASTVIDRLQQLARRVQRVLRINASTESAARRLHGNSLQAP